MANYEFAAVFDATQTDGQIQSAKEEVRQILLSSDCEITYIEEWGRRKMAYTVDKNKNEGFYIFFYFRVPTSRTPFDDLETYSRINDIMLRHLLVRVEKLKTEEDAQR